MTLQVAGLVLRVGAVLLAVWTASAVISESYAISGFLFYALYLYVVCRSVGIGLGSLLAALVRGSLFAAIGGLIGIIILWSAAKIVASV